jgi:uncharacterized protein DUF5615
VACTRSVVKIGAESVLTSRLTEQRRVPPLTRKDARATDSLLGGKARLLVDENIDSPAPILRDLGWDAVSAKEVGLTRRDDKELFAFGWRKKRVVVSTDHDFLDDRRFPFHRCQGVLIIPSPSEGMSAFADALANALPVIGRYAGAFDREKVVVSGDGTWVVRGFSKDRGVHWKMQMKVDEHGHHIAAIAHRDSPLLCTSRFGQEVGKASGLVAALTAENTVSRDTNGVTASSLQFDQRAK